MSGLKHCLYYHNCGGYLETDEQESAELCENCMEEQRELTGRAPNGHRDTIVPAPAPHKKRPHLKAAKP